MYLRDMLHSPKLTNMDPGKKPSKEDRLSIKDVVQVPC